MNDIISKLLKKMHERDQEERRELIEKHGQKFSESKNKMPFYVFKGACEERAKIALNLIDNNALKEPDDFYYAACIIINVESKENLITAYRLIKEYRRLGGQKPWGFKEKYFTIQNWGKTKEEMEKEIEKEIGIHPKYLDKWE